MRILGLKGLSEIQTGFGLLILYPEHQVSPRPLKVTIYYRAWSTCVPFLSANNDKIK